MPRYPRQVDGEDLSCRSAGRDKIQLNDGGPLDAHPALDRKADAGERFVHPSGIVAHALEDDIELDLVIGKGGAGDAAEDGEGVLPRELVAGEVEALAGEAPGVLKDANGDRPNVRDSN